MKQAMRRAVPYLATATVAVLLSACARAEILSGDSQWGCKEWRQHHAERTHRHACNNLHFITDLDRPQDIEDFERKYSQRLSWPSPS